MIRDVFLSVVFIGCQLLLVAALFEVFFRSRPGRPRFGAKQIGFAAVAAALVTTGLVDIAAAVSQRRADARRTAATLVGAVAQGRPVVVRFDRDACLRWNLGSIACRKDYHARYEAGTRRWIVTGYSRSSRAIITAAADNARGRDALSLWGALFRFDSGGVVYRAGERAGTIRIERSKP